MKSIFWFWAALLIKLANGFLNEFTRLNNQYDTWVVWPNETHSKDDWILIQHRLFGRETDFATKGWKEYVNGFGKPNGPAYWLGLKQMHQLTTSRIDGSWEALIAIRFDNTVGRGFNYAIYKNFKVESEVFEYALNVGNYKTDKSDFRFPYVGGYEIRNYLFKQYNRYPFTTKDRDNDAHAQNCGQKLQGGWWFKNKCPTSTNSRYSSTWHFCPNCNPIFTAYYNWAVTETYMGMRFVKSAA